MINKKIILILFLFMIFTAVVFLTACEGETEVITSDGSIDYTGMNLYWQNDYLQFAADENAKLSLYVRAEQDGNGEFMFDDGQEWLLVMETSFGNYPLFPRRYVQLGGVSCTVFNAFNEQSGEYDDFHVLVTVRESAGYEIYECTFDSDKKEFKSVTVYKAGNINPIGGSR